jgi:uncharacterized protein
MMDAGIWLEQLRKPELQEPVAIVGSPGLRSIGKLVVDQIIKKTKAELTAEIYSTHLPVVYHTKPSYVSHYSLPGIGGVRVKQGQVDLPKVQIYTCASPSLIITNGYHANFAGQYNVANRVISFLNDFGVTRIIVVAGYGSKTRKVCCAATSPIIIQEMKEKLKIEVDYVGPFYGFSGLVFGLAKLKEIDALCLFAGTEPNPDDPEFPDPKASEILMEVLNKILVFN